MERRSSAAIWACGFHQASRLERRHRQHGGRDVASLRHVGERADRRPRHDPVAQRGSERIGESFHPTLRLHEHRRGRPAASRAHRGLRSADQAPLRRLPRHQLRERGERGQPVDVPRVEPRQEGCHRHVGRLITQAAAQERTERFLGSVLTFASQQVLSCPAPPGPGHAGPAHHVADVAGDAERRVLQERHQPAIGPEVRTLRARCDELPRQSELPAEVHRPRLARDERVGTRLQTDVPHLHGAELAARTVGRFVHGDVDAGRGQPVRGRQAGDPAPDHRDPAGHRHLAGTSATCSRTTSASTSRYSGSAFGMRVRSNRVPACSAISRASMSRS